MVIVFCGHSNYIENIQDEVKILNILESEAGDSPCELFLGGYGNFDAFAFRCAKKFRQKHTLSKLIFVTPYLSRGDEQGESIYTMEELDSVLYPGLENVPLRYAISHRNRWMVEQADIVISFVSHRYGGAYTTYLNAKRNNKKIYNLGLLK